VYSDIGGKVAIVTGAGREGGLGAAIASRLAVEGAHVIVHDIGDRMDNKASSSGLGGSDELQRVVDGIQAAGGEASAFSADVTVESDIRELVQFAVKRYGRLDILINNAGVGFLFAPLFEMTQERWDTTLNVNLRGSFFALKHAAAQMATQAEIADWGRGRIISIASRAAKSGSALTSAYTASKHGLIGLTRSAAVELGPQRINVNAVCPNHVTTGLGAWQNEYMAKMKGLSVPDYLEAMRGRIPLGRVGEVEDTAKACAFLCSGEANYITGEAMNVSGGEEYH
jgi:NAD(P)-dependent dehydrogenase (short-subunit alcohol dehydrogenase family)